MVLRALEIIMMQADWCKSREDPHWWCRHSKDWHWCPEGSACDHPTRSSPFWGISAFQPRPLGKILWWTTVGSSVHSPAQHSCASLWRTLHLHLWMWWQLQHRPAAVDVFSQVPQMPPSRGCWIHDLCVHLIICLTFPSYSPGCHCGALDFAFSHDVGFPFFFVIQLHIVFVV